MIKSLLTHSTIDYACNMGSTPPKDPPEPTKDDGGKK